MQLDGLSRGGVLRRKSDGSDNSIHAEVAPSTVATEGAQSGQPSGAVGIWAEHRWPLAAAFTILVTGLAFAFWWEPVVHNASWWYTPTDLWSTFRSAQYVVWGGEGVIYASHTSLVTFPGISILLAPVAWLSGALHLSESFPVTLSRPTAWFVLGPADLLAGGFLLFPLDALARRLSVGTKRRIALVWLEAALIWPLVAMWGHPEDALALGFAIYGLLAGFDGAWVRVGVYFALAIVMQPLTILVLPIAFAYVPVRRWLPCAGVIALPSALLLLAPLVQEWGPTTYALVKQPNYPNSSHPTPWLTLAPVLRAAKITMAELTKWVTPLHGAPHLTEVRERVFEPSIVSAGPQRMIAVVLACLIGVWVARTKPALAQVVWLAAVALSLRCAFESVMVPYYLVPGLVLALVAIANARLVRVSATVLAVALCTWWSYRYESPWAYYVTVIGLLFVVLALARPARHDAPPTETLPVEPSDEFETVR